MSLLSVFLVLIILALVIGNGFLYLTKQRHKPMQELVQEDSSFESHFSAESIDSKLYSLQSNLKALNELIKMAHGRLLDVEEKVKAKKFQDPTELIEKLNEINEKLKKLENFKENTKVDLKGMKEIVLEMKEFLQNNLNNSFQNKDSISIEGNEKI